MRIIAIFLAMTISTTAIAQTAATAPLDPGKPAGVHQAQMALFGNPLYLALGVAAIAGIAVAASNSHSAGLGSGSTVPLTTTVTTTSTTSP